jgi:hypothetical protein
MLYRQSGAVVVSEPEHIAIPGKCPYTGNEREDFHVSRRFIDDLQKKGPTRKFYDGLLVSGNLEEPVVVLKGLRRIGFDDCFCYSMAPGQRWLDEQTPMRPPWMKVFLVYVRPSEDPKGFVVFDWEWKIEDHQKRGYPKHWQRDYGGQAWPLTN